MTKLGKALFVIFLLVLALTGCASRNSESQYKDLRQFIPDDADEQIEEMMRTEPYISFLGDSGRIMVDTGRARERSGDYSRTLLELLLLPRETYDSIEFKCYRGCGDAGCTDPDHYHWCVFDCEEPDHYHNFTPSKGCTDRWCTNPDHFHWCPNNCKEVEHYHKPSQWNQFK